MGRWLAAGIVVSYFASTLALALVTVALARKVSNPTPQPWASVYEYASNRLCKISEAECERLARVILKAENDNRSQSTPGNSR